ncbi:MAG: ABC transporter ATP-binding protein [Nocardioides sp.]
MPAPEAAESGVTRVMLSYVAPQWRQLAMGAALGLATAATGLALPLVVRELIGRLDSDGLRGTFLVWMALLVLANAALGALGYFVLQRTAEAVVLAARTRLVKRLMRLRVSAVELAEPGDLMSRVTADTTLLREVTTDSFVGGATGVITLAATLVMMGVLDTVLLAVTVGALLMAVIVIGVVAPRINRAARAAQESVGVMGAALERMFGAFRTVKASGAEDRETERLEAAAMTAYHSSVSAAKWTAVAGNTAGLAAQAAFVVVLSVGGARVASGRIDVATLVAFLLYIYYLLPPVSSIAAAVSQYQVGAAAVARIMETQRLPVESAGTDRALLSSSEAPAAVEFQAVDFRYRPELPPVHQAVSFTVPAGGMTAFVGPSGAGKTTVFSLIERFYDPDAGRVLIDGTDVAGWPLHQLRSIIGYVEQDAPILSGTLRENLTFAAMDATEEALREVVRTTRLDDLVASLPDGLDATVGHRGIKLSGGEKQRVAIARALLRRPRLLLLDEATSQLDAVNEAALRETIAAAARVTTVLVVAHRLSTVTMADQIIVIDRGQVRAEGTHHDLLRSDPLYAELAAAQFLASSALD